MIIHKKTIVITGSSSGIGKALAMEYANENTRLFLFGRSSSRLEEVASICRNNKAEVITITCDVRHEQQMRARIEGICKKHKIDILISCAGISAGTLGTTEVTQQVNQIFATNINGTLNTIMPALPFMIERKHGSIVIISSMAALIGLSSAPSYSASKAAVKTFGDGLRVYLKRFNLQVCVVVPGFIDTPMTKVNKFQMPFKISAYQAAKIIIQGINAKKGLIVFPKSMYFILRLINLLPYPLVDYINSKLHP